MTATLSVVPPNPRSIPPTVGWVINSASVQRGRPRIVSGHAGLDRPVRWVHSGDLTSTVSLLRGGEVLLTTIAGVPEDPGEQRRLLDRATEAGLAGLIVELGDDGVLPDSVIAAATSRDLPVAVLHGIVSFSDVTEETHRHILANEPTVTHPTASADKRLINVMLAGGRVTELLDEFADIVHLPVILARHDGAVVAIAAHDSSSEELVTRWHARSNLFRGDDFELVDVPMRDGEIWGTLAVMTGALPFQHHDRAVMDRAAELVGIGLLRRREEEVLVARGCGEFIMSALSENADPDDLERRASQLGFADWEWLMPCVVRPGDALYTDEAAWATVARDISSELAGRKIPALVGSLLQDAGIAMIVSPRDGDRSAFATPELIRTIRRFVTRHLGETTDVVVSIGGVVHGWRTVRHVLVETLEVSRHGLPRGCDGWQDATAPDLEVLIRAMRDSTLLRRFVDRRLLPLIDHDRDRRSDLIKTLEALFAHDGNKADTARALHLERQSLYHRLSKIESIIGGSLADEDTRLGLHVALRTLRMSSLHSASVPKSAFWS